MAAFMPGASPPLVRTATRFISLNLDELFAATVYYEPGKNINRWMVYLANGKLPLELKESVSYEHSR
jgi:hypothetical protein